ncbi:helix-turn-helix transcriptional regulator [Mesorhizobium sp. LNJC391B00]|uniref:LuxR C-terminal-related transcriptional regulator n=1 Tax=Mesorhizobium sp. LNJC391B00 TaxID=1287273 RepID=UPI0018DBBFC7
MTARSNSSRSSSIFMPVASWTTAGPWMALPLSRREMECLKWAARGKTAWEIGRILGISRSTAAYHRDNARKKLGVKTAIQAAVRLALSRPSLFT